MFFRCSIENGRINRHHTLITRNENERTNEKDFSDPIRFGHMIDILSANERSRLFLLWVFVSRRVQLDRLIKTFLRILFFSGFLFGVFFSLSVGRRATGTMERERESLAIFFLFEKSRVKDSR